MADTNENVPGSTGSIDSRKIAVISGVSRVPAISLMYASEVAWGPGLDRKKSQHASVQDVMVALRLISGAGTFLFNTEKGASRLEVDKPSVIFFKHRDARRTTVTGDHLRARWYEFYADADIDHWFCHPISAPLSEDEDKRCAAIQEHLASSRGNDHAYAAALFSQLVYSWLRNSEIDARDPNQRIVSDAMALFRDGVHESVRVESVAKRVGVHAASLRRLFRIHLKISPKQYLDKLRFAEAKRLLQEGAAAKRVSNLLGFENQSQFTRFFKGRAGVNVRDYQKRNCPKK